MLFDVLNPKMSVFGQYFLEASAGTGKTFAIENIVPRLLLESKTPIKIDSILVVTFTRAATRELKGRIYKNLLKISSALDQREGGPLYLEAFYQGSSEELRTAKRKVEEALFSFEKAQIFTLHSFCLSILQEFAFEAGFFLPKGQTENAAETELLREYVKDFFRKGLTLDLLSSSQLRKISTHKKIGKNIESLIDVVLRILEKEQDIRGYLFADEQWKVWNQTLKSMPRRSSVDLWKELSACSTRLSKSKKWALQIEAFFSFIEKGEASYSEWDLFLKNKEFFLEQKELVKKNFLAETRLIFVELFESANNPKKLLLQLAKACKIGYDKGKKDLSLFSPDDFVITLKKALLNENFKEKIREKYKALIIDEFQDTDLDQWNIFYSLFLSPEYKLPVVYLVGDPKQAIYGFRSADVYIYLKARGFFSEENRFYLGTNFRSHPELVQALNVLFSFKMPGDWMLLPFIKESLEVREVESRPWQTSLLSGEKKGRIHFFLKEVENQRSVEEDFLIPYIAEEILRLKNEKGVSFEKIAVLVKDRFQAEKLQKTFYSYGIPCQMQKSFSMKSLAYEGMKSLLQAVAFPSNSSLLKKFLGGVLMGYSCLELVGSWENPFLQRAREYFIESSFVFKKKGFGAFFYEFLSSSSKEEELTVGEELLSRKDTSLYFELRQIFQIIMSECSSELYDVEAILSFLEEIAEKDSKSEIFKQPLEEEKEQIQVMTLHKSKGLEFDVVFALALGSRFTGKEEFISVRKEGGREITPLDEDESAYFLHVEELDAEKLRLLYVALTRAKERVYVPYLLYKNQQELVRGTAAPIELFLNCFGQERCSFSELYQRAAMLSLEQCISQLVDLGSNAFITYETVSSNFGSQELFISLDQEELMQPPTTFFSYQEEFVVSFSSLIQEGKKEEIFSKEILKESFVIPPGPDTGTVIHSILEELCKTGLHQKMDQEARCVVQTVCLGTVLESKEDTIFSLLQEVMNKEISTPNGKFCLKDIPSSDMQVEVEFLYPIKGSLVKGFIDLLLRFNGCYFVLDWKTNVLGLDQTVYSDEQVKKCVEESRYNLQAAIYGVAVKKMLSIFDERNFKECFGGAIYFFLRGNNSYFFYPDFSLLDACSLREF